MGPRLSRGRVHFLSFFKRHSLVRPASILPSRPPSCALPSRAVVVKDGASFSGAAEGLSLTDASTAARYLHRATARLMIQGELAIGGARQRAAILYSAGPSGS